MKHLRTEIEIGASNEKVWQVLTGFSSFPEWNPFIKRVQGEAKEGEKLEVSLQPPGGTSMTFRSHVVTADPGKELRWLGKVGVPGIFDGEHYFIIEIASDNQVRLIHGEYFRGILVPLMALMGLFGKTKRGFEEMNQALKTRVEK